MPEPETTSVPAETAPAPAPAPAEPAAGEPARGRGAVRPSLLHRWVHGPDRPVARAAGAVIMAALLALDGVDYFVNVVGYWRIALVFAILGLVVAAAEMPPRWTTTFVHGLNSAYFVVLSVVIMHLYASYFFPSGGLSPLLQLTLLAGTIVYGIGAIIVSVSVGRGDRSASSILALIAMWLIVIGAIFLTLSSFNESVEDGRTGIYALLAAALASLLAAVSLLYARARPAPQGPGT